MSTVISYMPRMIQPRTSLPYMSCAYMVNCAFLSYGTSVMHRMVHKWHTNKHSSTVRPVYKTCCASVVFVLLKRGLLRYVWRKWAAVCCALLAVVKRWLPGAVAVVDRFHCITLLAGVTTASVCWGGRELVPQ